MNPVDATTVPRLPRGVRLHFDRVREAHVLLAPERAFSVDERAVSVLKLVDGTRNVGTIAAELATQFNADAAVIERDVAAMLGGLIDKRVVET